MDKYETTEGTINRLWEKDGRVFLKIDGEDQDEKPYGRPGTVPEYLQNAFEKKETVKLDYVIADGGWKNIINAVVVPKKEEPKKPKNKNDIDTIINNTWSVTEKLIKKFRETTGRDPQTDGEWRLIICNLIKISEVKNGKN